MSHKRTISILCLFCLFFGLQAAEMNFSKRVGPVTIKPVTTGKTTQVPYITWGGDMITFFANGGLRTKPGSIVAGKGMDLQLTAGDDFVAQVKNYMEGKTPFLRGTARMMGMAAEVVNADPRTRGVVIMQLTWSAGDHLVGSKGIGTAADLRGKRIALQFGGPHVGMLDDILSSAQLGWDDITPVWCADLTGTDDSAAAKMRAGAADAACVITPDMVGLSGGLRDIGSGAEGTVEGARVVVSTAEMSRSIADIYVVRKDFYDANKPFVKKFIAAYLEAAEQVVPMRNAKEDGKKNPTYRNLLKLSQDIFGADVIVDLDMDGHGLLLDCTPVGWPGNHAFFNQKGSINNVGSMMDRAIGLARRLGMSAPNAEAYIPADFDWKDSLISAKLKNLQTERADRFQAEAVLEEIEALDDELDDRTILSFAINFEPNQKEFNAKDYAAEYKRVVELSQRYGNAVVAIRGHADPTKTLGAAVRAGMQRGIIKRSGTKDNRKYFLNGRPFDLNDTRALVGHVKQGTFAGVPEFDPLQIMTAALNLSRQRADAVRGSIVDFAKQQGLAIDQSQIQPLGVGVAEPLVPRPRSMEEAKMNMRVEFRLLRVEAEAVSTSDFDY